MEMQPLINPNTFHDYLTRLLAIGNSVSALGAFLLLTKGMPRNKINQIIFISSLTCLITLVGFMFIGTRILNFFGISINAFQVAGGILLGKVGLEMLGHSPEKINDPKSNNLSFASTLDCFPGAAGIKKPLCAFCAVLDFNFFGSLGQQTREHSQNKLPVFCAMQWRMNQEQTLFIPFSLCHCLIGS